LYETRRKLGINFTIDMDIILVSFPLVPPLEVRISLVNYY
jgi:hypothetical protein